MGTGWAPRARRARGTALAVVAAGLWLTAAATAAPPHALFYESVSSTDALVIDRLDLSPPRTVSTVVPVGNVNLFGIAVAGSDVLWSYEAGAADRGAIMLAPLGGGRIRRLVGGLAAPAAILAVRGYVYWIDAHAIGRVALDGAHLRRRFLVLPSEPGGGVADGLATDGHHLLFSRCQDDAIGRVDLTGRDLVRRFISTAAHSCPQGLAVAGGHVYWSQLGSATIGRATLHGQHVDGRWLAIRTGQGPFQVAADTGHVYWTWGGELGTTPYTGRADADGSDVEPRFLRGSLYPMAVTGGGAEP